MTPLHNLLPLLGRNGRQQSLLGTPLASFPWNRRQLETLAGHSLDRGGSFFLVNPFPISPRRTSSRASPGHILADYSSADQPQQERGAVFGWSSRSSGIAPS